MKLGGAVFYPATLLPSQWKVIMRKGCADDVPGGKEVKAWSSLAQPSPALSPPLLDEEQDGAACPS